jgi:uncharacterized protein YdaU (DUF1376 family)
MHYYQFHIADFTLHTTHLSLEEEAVYRRLLDYYYDTEKPIPKETNAVIRRLRLVNYAEIVSSVLAEFFVLQDDGWHNLRADFEIDAYHLKAETAKANGKKGGRPKKNNPAETQPVILANPAETGSKANQEPETINQEPETNITPTAKSKISPCPVEQIIQLYENRCTRLPRLRVIPDKTRNAISARWRQDSKFQSIEFWQGFFDYCNENRFLSGQAEPRPGGQKPFRADLNWIVKPESFANIINEKYA